MGLAAIGSAILGFFGAGAARTAVAGGGAIATAAGRTILQRAGAAAISPFGQSVIGGALGAGAISAFGGDGAAAGGLPGGQLGAIVAAGGQPTPLSNGRFLVTAPNGDIQIFNRNGMAIRPTLLIPAGQRLPGGAVVVSTRNGGSLIGVTIRRRRRRFGAEIRTVRRTVQAAQALVKLCQPTKRRA